MSTVVDDPGASLGIALLVVLAICAVGVLLFCSAIRLAVRHGTSDAWKRLPGGPGSAGGVDDPRPSGRHRPTRRSRQRRAEAQVSGVRR